MTARSQRYNPYSDQRGESQSNGFFDRKDILQTIGSTLVSDDQSALVLVGQRRIGKTSILPRDRAPPTCAILSAGVLRYDALVDQPLGYILAQVALTIAKHIRMEEPNPEQFDNEGRFFRESFLPALYELLGEDRDPVLLLDEFDTRYRPSVMHLFPIFIP